MNFFAKTAGAVGVALGVTAISIIAGNALVPLKKELIPEAELAARAANATKGGPSADLPALLAVADVKLGKKLANKCVACHSMDKGGATRIGPNQWNLIGRDKAMIKDFAYSPGLAKKGGQWTFADLDAFLADPKKFAPGNKMAMPAMKDPQERADVIAYLRTLSDKPVAMPAIPAGMAQVARKVSEKPKVVEIPQENDPAFAGVAGIKPYERMAGAPKITAENRDAAWQAKALRGVSQPYPVNVTNFLKDQGNWHNPFLHPGMPSYYDIRGWHKG